MFEKRRPRTREREKTIKQEKARKGRRKMFGFLSFSLSPVIPSSPFLL
jgi:hypothetical protein